MRDATQSAKGGEFKLEQKKGAKREAGSERAFVVVVRAMTHCSKRDRGTKESSENFPVLIELSQNSLLRCSSLIPDVRIVGASGACPDGLTVVRIETTLCFCCS